MQRVNNDMAHWEYSKSQKREQHAFKEKMAWRAASPAHVEEYAKKLHNPEAGGFIKAINSKYKNRTNLKTFRGTSPWFMDRTTSDCQYQTTAMTNFTCKPKQKIDRKLTDEELDEIYQKHMKKKQDFERKIWEQRKEKYIKDELEY